MAGPEQEKDCSAVLGVSDEEWLQSHRALIDAGFIPAEELGYLYDPDRPAEDVDVSELSFEVDPKEPPRG